MFNSALNTSLEGPIGKYTPQIIQDSRHEKVHSTKCIDSTYHNQPADPYKPIIRHFFSRWRQILMHFLL